MSEMEPALTLWMGPVDANAVGTVHGGVVLRLIDEAGGLAAIRFAHMRVATAAVDSMSFRTPVYVGELLSLKSRVNQVWNSSMEVEVEAWAESPATRERRLVATAFLTMVALDENVKPVKLPEFTDGDPEIMAAADARREQRLAER
ncbi:MAG: acyl-CoA thioesterase [Solirubrobacteraceae bacterium]|nr:acyl-CoA thioesterase [Solirubrobacteraceae bacterium]